MEPSDRMKIWGTETDGHIVVEKNIQNDAIMIPMATKPTASFLFNRDRFQRAR